MSDAHVLASHAAGCSLSHPANWSAHERSRSGCWGLGRQPWARLNIACRPAPIHTTAATYQTERAVGVVTQMQQAWGHTTHQPTCTVCKPPPHHFVIQLQRTSCTSVSASSLGRPLVRCTDRSSSNTSPPATPAKRLANLSTLHALATASPGSCVWCVPLTYQSLAPVAPQRCCQRASRPALTQHR